MKAIRGTLAALAACTALALAAAPVQAAKFYKWVDEKGVTHYGEQAPKDAKSTTVKVGDTTSSDADDEIKALNDKRSAIEAAKKKAADNTAAGPSDADKDRNQKLCDQHRKNLATLKSGNRVLTKDEKGNQRFLNEQEVADQVKFTEGEVQRCDQQKVPAGAGAKPSASKFGP